MILLATKIFLIIALPWAVWKLLRRFVLKNPLDNIPGPPYDSFISGNFQQIFDPAGWDFHKNIAAKYGGIIRLKALFGENILYVSDPKALNRIFQKQRIEQTLDVFTDSNLLLMGRGILNTKDDDHWKQRKMLIPAFSIAHLREMTPAFWDVTHRLRNTLAAKVRDGPKEIDISHWITRTALELIGQSGFGYSFDPLTEHGVPHPFCDAVKQMLPIANTPGLVFLSTYTMPYITWLGPAHFRRRLVDLISLVWENARRLRDVTDVMESTAHEILDAKKRAVREGSGTVKREVEEGRDVLSVLLRESMKASDEDRPPEEELLGQIAALTFAAMDTTSASLALILDQISRHPDVQDKLRAEILEARERRNYEEGDELSYEEVVALPYLDAVCRETLRLFPPISQITRTTRVDLPLPLTTPIRGLNGQWLDEIVVPRNTNLIASLLSANRSPEIWGADANEWKPERWLAPLPGSVSEAKVPGIYSNMMTFSGGGRSCIGFKFAELEMKVVLTALLAAFEFAPSREKEISWQLGPITTPAVVGEDSLKSMLPMIVSLV